VNTREEEIVKAIEIDLRLQKDASRVADPGELDAKWSFLTSKEPKRFINDDLTVKLDVLRSFRRMLVFIPEEPSWDIRRFSLRSLVGGGRRGTRRLLREFYTLVEEQGALDILERNPVGEVGRAYQFQYKGLRYTWRWIRHVLFVNLFRKYIAPEFDGHYTVADLGSSFGLFSHILKSEFPEGTHVLLDFPEQLVLAHYYLGMSFPDAKIAGYHELTGAGESITADFLKCYDFVLVPWFLFKNIEPGAIEVFTNFASLGEMKREWFDFYLKSEQFAKVKFFLTANRIQGWPTYDTDLCILDYPLEDFECVHFSLSPYFDHLYTRDKLFLSKLFPLPPYFEFVGRRNLES